MFIKYSEHEHFNARIYIIHSITKDWTVYYHEGVVSEGSITIKVHYIIKATRI